ncbi:MAG: flagellar basal body rod protein FlgB [Chloroflexi bacterium]|nr:flagellar basal body rod protein FlgB [Chloroflexota bacterium]
MEIGKTTTDRLYEAALTGLATRQRVIGDNVANVDTPRFKASQVQFEQALLRATGRGQELPLQRIPNAMLSPEPSLLDGGIQVIQTNATTRRIDGNNVDIDQEMIQLAETNITYNALTTLAHSRSQLLRQIITDGRR